MNVGRVPSSAAIAKSFFSSSIVIPEVVLISKFRFCPSRTLTLLLKGKLGSRTNKSGDTFFDTLSIVTGTESLAQP